MSDTLADSRQYRVFLTPPELDGEAVIHPEGPLERLLVQDMGGHGAALEILQEVLAQRSDPLTPLSSIASALREGLTRMYLEWLRHIDVVLPALRAVLMRKRVKRGYTLEGTSMLVDEVIQLGLFRLRPDELLDCPFVWVWLMSTQLTAPLPLQQIFGYAYSGMEAQVGLAPERGLEYWQQWEMFNARFRVLKSQLLCPEGGSPGVRMSLMDLHSGARFSRLPGGERDPDVLVRRLTGVVQAHDQYETRSDKGAHVIKGEQETVDLRVRDDVLVLNGTSAPAGDAFLRIRVFGAPDASASAGGLTVVNEVHQYKREQKPVTTEAMLAELGKSAVAGQDVFLLMTTGPSEVDIARLPPRCGIVAREWLGEYYGPFVGRAFSGQAGRVPINTARRAALEAVCGIGPQRSEMIMQGRPFKDVRDCHKRTKLPLGVLDAFDFAL